MAKLRLLDTFQEMNQVKVRSFLSNGSNWIIWHENQLAASCLSSIWERIRSAGTVFAALIITHCRNLDDNTPTTLLVEVKALTSSRPLTVETNSAVDNHVAIFSMQYFEHKVHCCNATAINIWKTERDRSSYRT